MTIAYYACPIISIMTKILWIIIYPMAKGLDKLLGVHNHHRVQHKDFANFLTGNVIKILIIENVKKNIKNASYFNIVAEMSKSLRSNDTFKKSLYD
jgi:hypothetical protein